MCYFANSYRIYAFRHWRVTGYKVLDKVRTDSLIYDLKSQSCDQVWKKGETYRSGAFDPRGSGPGFYAFRRRKDAERARGHRIASVVVKVRLSGRVSRFAKRERFGSYAGYKASKARLLKVYE